MNNLKEPFMKRSSTILLQAVVVLIGIGALALILWEPQIEGRNAHATQFEIYFNDPFLAYAYTASIFFFVALYQAFKILGYVRQNKTFSQETVKALRTIKFCAITVVAFAVGAEVWIMIMARHTHDDAAGGVFIGLLMIAVSGIFAIVAGIIERLVQNAVDIKSENDLTV